jgi:hypothetical protein
MRYILSPEFHRNLWEKFTPFRAAAALVFLLLSVLVMQNADYPDPASKYKSLAAYAMCLYFLIVFVWGNYEAAAAMPEEGRRNTWDFQRMSAQGPARLWFGKFFGATSYTWYAGCLTLAIFAGAYWDIPVPRPGRALAEYVPNHELPYVLLLALLAGLTGQAVAFFGGAIEFQAAGGQGRWKIPRGVTSFLLGLAVSWSSFMETAWLLAHKLRHPHVLSFWRGRWQVDWYFQKFPAEHFYAASLLFFAGSALAAGYFATRASLMYAVTPAPLMAFVAAFAAWFSGFGVSAMGGAPAQLDVLRGLFFGFMLTAGLCYAAMLIEAGSGLKYARFAFHLRRHEAGKAFENMPVWLAVAAFPLAFMAATALYAGGASPTVAAAEGYNYFVPGFSAHAAHIDIFMLTVLLFMARDACIVHALHLFNRTGAVYGIVFYYISFYVLLPMLGYAVHPVADVRFSPVALIGGSIGDSDFTAAADFITPLFFPTRISDPLVSILPAAAQVAVAALILHGARGARRKRLEATA